MEMEVEVQTGADDAKTKKVQTVKPKPAEPVKKPAAKRTLLERAKDKAAEMKAAAGKYIDDKVRVVIENVQAIRSWYNERSLKKIETVNPLFAKILPRAKELFMARTKGADVQIGQGQRSAAEQNELFKSSRTKPGPWLTNADGYKNKSNHQSPNAGLPGQAVDVDITVNGKYITKGDDPHYRKFFECVVQAAEEAGIKKNDMEWGGTWQVVDAAHIQYNGPMKAGPPSVTNKKAAPAFKKAAGPCKVPTPATRFMDKVVPPGSVLDDYLQRTAPAIGVFKM